MAWSNALFYIIFLGQILLMSWYFPRELLGRMQHVLEAYPPTSFPKLYPRPIEDYKIAQWKFRMVNRVILALGFVVLFMVMFVIDHSTFADDGHISVVFPLVYGLIQFLPLMALELSEFGHVKQMRKANTSTVRKTELTRRGLFDVVSPALFAMTLLFFASAILFDLYAHDFKIIWGHDTFERVIVLTMTNLMLAGVGGFTLYGRTRDPYQSSADRTRKVSASMRTLLYCSMALSVFFVTAAADDMFDIDYLDAIVMSVYFQGVVLLSLGNILRNVKVEDIDFDVYKEDVAAT
jgi:hypothetical protein